MCGHVGIAGNLELKDEKTFQKMLVLDTFRGPDSTGFASIRNNGDVKIAKIASHPFDLFDTKKFNDAFNAFSSTVLLGHNRLATKGKVNHNNAHPFEYGHIIGAHNGTLHHSSWQALDKLNGEPTDVDSQAIFLAISKFGIEETIKHMEGAWALVWIDMEKKTLNFLRNKERTFWYGYTEDWKKLFWASEWPMIRAACDLSDKDYKMAALDAKGHQYFMTTEDWWYRWNLDDLKFGYKDQPKPLVRELKGKEPVQVQHAAGGTSNGNFPSRNFGSNGSGCTNSHGQRTSTTTSHGTMHSIQRSNNTGSTTSSDADIIDITGFRYNPFDGHVSKEKFKEYASCGCAWCSASVEYGDPGITVYDRDGYVLCAECSDNKDNTRVYVDGQKFDNVRQASKK